MIYLDNAATSWPKPPEVIAAMQTFLEEAGGNPGRSGHRRSVASQRVVGEAQARVAKLLGDVAVERVAFFLNGTDALNAGIKGVLRPGDHAIFTAAEHNSVRRPLHGLKVRDDVTLTEVPVSPGGFVDPDDVRRALMPKTRLVACVHVSNVTGAVQPITDIGRITREHGAFLLVDAAQSVGVLDVHPETMNTDLVAFPGHKALMGPMGTGVLYVGPRVEVQPWREGGTGSESNDPSHPATMPTRLEAGTPNAIGLAGLGAALKLVRPAETWAHEQALLAKMRDGLSAVSGMTLHTPDVVGRQAGVLSLTINGFDPLDVAGILDDSFDIAVRAGLHCAPGMHRAIGTWPAGTVRASLSRYSSESDVDGFISAVRRIADSA